MSAMRSRLLALVTLVSMCVAGIYSADATFGPKVGTRAPDIGALQDQTGAARKMTRLAGPKGTVVVFYRSAGWCPFCQAQLIALNAGAKEIEQRGYRIVGVSYDTPEVAKAFSDRRAITFTLLSDPKSVVIDRWGLRDPQYPAGHRAHGVPRPAIFIVDRKGQIRASLAEEAYQKRPPVAEVIKALDAIP